MMPKGTSVRKEQMPRRGGPFQVEVNSRNSPKFPLPFPYKFSYNFGFNQKITTRGITGRGGGRDKTALIPVIFAITARPM